LVKTDRATMANSLEARSPFLDRELVEYVAALPDTFKLRGRVSKAILRDAFADLLPAEIDRRPKMGFGVPLGTWFRGQLREYVRDVLLAPNAKYRDSLSGPFVERLVEQHLAGRVNVGPQLWALVTYERWLQLLSGWRGTARLMAPPVATSRAGSGGVAFAGRGPARRPGGPGPGGHRPARPGSPCGARPPPAEGPGAGRTP